MQASLIPALQRLGLIRALTLLTCSYIFPWFSETFRLIEGFSKRIFILGPSHHYYLQGCALSKCTEYKTPVGDLPIDVKSLEHISFLIKILMFFWFSFFIFKL